MNIFIRGTFDEVIEKLKELSENEKNLNNKLRAGELKN